MGLYRTTEEASTPSTPSSGQSVLYPKTDGAWYWKDSSGGEHEIAANGEEITGATLNNCVGKGTWTASGTWTLPALTLGGNVASTGNPSLNIGSGALTAGATSVTTLSATLNSNTTTGIATNNSSNGILARNGLLATADAADGFFGVNGSGYTGVSGWADAGIININGASNGLIFGLDGVTKAQVTIAGLAITGVIEGAEQTAPSAPVANGYRIFAQDNGAGKTQLMVIFASGAAQQIAIEP